MFESHITIRDLSLQDFQEKCRDLKVKALLIQDDTSSGIDQMMTSKFHKTQSLEEAMAEMNRIADSFQPYVLRKKLERIIGRNQTVPDHLYLEFHTKYAIPMQKLKEFLEIVEAAGCHTSTNSFKQQEGNVVHYFATARTTETHQRLCRDLSGFLMINTIMECVVYDDFPEVDSRWVCDCPLKAYLVGI